jgi:DNA mismatch repair protein MutS
LTYLLNFVHEHNPHLVHRITEPVFENQSDRMVLANHSLKQLNIIDDDNGAKSGGKCSSVYKLLNNCMTPMGARHFRTRLLNPSCSAAKMQREYDITDHLLLTTDAWRPQLAQLKDLEKFNRLIMLRKCRPRCCTRCTAIWPSLKNCIWPSWRMRPLGRTCMQRIRCHPQPQTRNPCRTCVRACATC